MTWAKIDDRLHAHPKVAGAGLEAMGLWVLGLSHCSAYLTDGFISEQTLKQLAGKRGQSLAKLLVNSGLWDEETGGWRYHDYLVLNPSAEQIKQERARKTEAGRAGGFAKSASRNLAGATPPASAAALLPIPSRPDPIPSGGSTAPTAPAPHSLPEPSGSGPEAPKEGSGKVVPARATRQVLLPGFAAKPSKIENGEATVWRVWRELYGGSHYRRAYTSAPEDGKAVKAYTANARAQLEADLRPAGDLEALARHQLAAYLRDTGSKGFVLRDHAHGLRWLAHGLPTYGTPWSKAATQVQVAAPLEFVPREMRKPQPNPEGASQARQVLALLDVRNQ